MTSKLVVNTIEADTGISSVSFASSISMSSTSKFHFSAAGINIDADTNINRPSAGVLGFNINSSEKMRLDSSGRLLIGTTTEGNESADELTINSSGNTGVTVRSGSSSNGSLFFSDTTSGAAEYVGFVQYQHASNAMIFGTSSTERLRITSDGSIGINATTPSAGDLATGDSQNTPVLHVNGSGASDTTGEYNLIARFEGGGDADSTGAMIVINHGNDRGLAIQGGRRTGNYAHGALKMIDNVGRLSNAIFIHGGAGQGVNHMGFYTGESTTTTERMHLNSTGGVGIGTVPTASSSRLTLYEESGNGQTIEIKAKNNGGVGSQPGIKFTHQNGSGVANIYTDNSSSSLRFATGASVSNRVIITPTGDFNTYNDTNDEGIFVRNTANNAAIRIYASGGSPSGAYRIAHNGPTDALQIDRTNTSGAYSDIVLGFYSDRTWKRAPIGTVVKVGYNRYDPNSDNYPAIGQDTKSRSAVYLDFTPIRSDSKLIIMTRMHTRMIAAQGCSYGIDYSTNSGSSWTVVDGMYQRNAMDFFYKGDGANHHYTGFCMRQIDSYSGTRRFSPWGQGWSGGTWEISYGHGEHSVTIFEVAT